MDTKIGGIAFELSFDGSKMLSGINTSCEKIKQSFEKSFQKAGTSATKAVKTSSQEIQNILDDTEKSAKSKAASIAAVYKKEGYSSSEAFKKAWEHIERSSQAGASNTKRHISGIGDSINSMTSLAKKLGIALLAAFSVRKIFDLGKQCLELASDLQEVQNVVDVTFPGMTAHANEFAKSAAASFGLSETMAKRFTGTFGAMAKSFGFSESAAYDMSTALTGLAGDVASFYNISQDEAYTKLKSVFTGETETLKDLGVVMTQTALDAYALANGYGKTTKSMSEAEKVALRYAFVQNQLSAAAGDFARTSDSWANQTRVLKLNLQQLGATIGGTLINAFKPLVSYLNVAIGKFTEFAQAVSNSLGKIFGWSFESTGSGVASDLTVGAGAANDIASGLNSAAGNAKKLKQQLRGVDELNIVSKDNGSSNSSGSGSTGTSAETGLWKQSDSIVDGNKIAENFAGAFEDGIRLVKKIIEDFKVGDYFMAGQDTSKLVAGIFNFFAEAIDSVDWESIGAGIGDFIEGINWTIILLSVGKLIWEAINAGVEYWKGMFNAAPIETAIVTGFLVLNLTPLGTILFTKLTGILTPIFISIGTSVGETFLAGFQALIGGKAAASALTFMNPITKAFVGIGSIVAGVSLAFTSFFSMLSDGFNWFDEMLMLAGIGLTAVGAIVLGAPAMITGVIAAIVAAVATAVILIKDNWESIKKFFSDLCIKLKGNFAEAWTRISGIFSIVATWFLENVINPIITLFDGFKTRVGQIFEGCWIIIQAVWIVVSAWFKENVIEPIVKFFSPIVKNVGKFFSDLWSDIKNIWKSVSGWFDNNICTPLIKLWEKVTSKIGDFFSTLWSGIAKGVANAMNAVIGGIESAINYIVNGINKIINGFNKVVSWAAKVADTDWGGVDNVPTVSLKRINIQKFETGGFPEDGWFRAKHGEIMGQFDNGKSVVANNNQITDGISSAVYRGNQENNALMREEIILMKQQNELLLKILQKENGISPDDIFGIVRKEASSYTKRTGEPAFSY